MENLIKELNELQATLKADGYKDWCYAQLTIDKAIEAVKRCNLACVINKEAEQCQYCGSYVTPITNADIIKAVKIKSEVAVCLICGDPMKDYKEDENTCCDKCWLEA